MPCATITTKRLPSPSQVVTLFTDASFSSDHKCASWAIWAKYGVETTLRRSGMLRSKVNYSGDAELAAIANGIYLVTTKLAPAEGTKIILRSDCQEANMALLLGSHKRQYCRAILVYITTMLANYDYSLELRHVAGHKGTKDAPSAVNTFCDQEAKRVLGNYMKENLHVELRVRKRPPRQAPNLPTPNLSTPNSETTSPC